MLVKERPETGMEDGKRGVIHLNGEEREHTWDGKQQQSRRQRTGSRDERVMVSCSSVGVVSGGERDTLK